MVCPSCGRVNRSGARYCASCQAPLGVTVAKLKPGQLLAGGAYRVVRPLGKGGMGAVYLVAQTRAFDRLAVIKEVIDYFDPSNAGERKMAEQRFEAEARTLGDLKYPGIPDLYAFFSEDGHNYLVMEYIEGPDLRQGLTRQNDDTGQLLPGGPLPAERVLRYAIQVCEILEYLASREPPVVHNDIKPGNILIDSHSRRAFLVDFGTAKTRYLRTAGMPDGKKASVYGTVGYAAPELYRGYSEPRSDVYSLAATIYHLLTDDDPRDHPSQYPQLDTLPPALVAILRGGLAPEPEDRPSASEFRAQMESYLDGLARQGDAAALPPGKMELRTTSLRLLPLAPNQRISQVIQVANRGPGYLLGEITSTQPWVKTGTRFSCPPGHTCDIPIEIDTTGLAAGRSFLAAVTLSPAGGVPDVVGVQVAVSSSEAVPTSRAPAAPAIGVSPGRVDFGRVPVGQLGTAPQTIDVINVGGASAQVRVQGAPEWLLVKPTTFHLQAGAKQVVTLVGRMAKVPGRKQSVTLTFVPDGGEGRQVEVRLQVRRRGLFG